MVPLVVRVEDTEGGRPSQFAFLKSPVRIGRGELNDLQLDRPFVSTYHGLVHFDEQVTRYVDLGSTNGSLLDGDSLDRNTLVTVTAESVIDIGTFRLRFERRITSDRHTLAPRDTAFSARVSTLTPSPFAGAKRPGGEPPARAEPEPSPPATPPAPVVGGTEMALAMAEALILSGLEKPGPAPSPGQAEAAARTEADARAEAALQAARAEAVTQADAALEGASLTLDLDYASYRGTWEHLRAALDELLASQEGLARKVLVERLAERYPAIAGEPHFAAHLPAPPDRPGEPPPVEPRPAAPAPAEVRPVAPGAAPDAARLLTAFSQSYLPGVGAPATSADVERMLGRTAAVLETFARSYLELRRGYEEFGREMGVRTVHGDGMLTRTSEVSQVLSYLLDPSGQGRDSELQRAFADFMIHQVALLRGVVEGARALLAELAPEAIAGRTPSRLLSVRAAELWAAYQARYQELADEDAALSEILFGKEFARAYSAMSGEGASGREEEE